MFRDFTSVVRPQARLELSLGRQCLGVAPLTLRPFGGVNRQWCTGPAGTGAIEAGPEWPADRVTQPKTGQRLAACVRQSRGKTA